MTSFTSGSVDYYLSKRYLPSSQVERVPNVEELEDEEIETDGPVASLRSANFMPHGMSLGGYSPGVASIPAVQSPLFSPVYAQLSNVKQSKLSESSTDAQKLRRKLMRGANVLIIQGGYSGKKFIYEKLKELGVRVTVMDGPESYWKIAAEEGLIQSFVEIDFSDNATVFERAIDIVMSLDTNFDAVTTYYEDAVPLATRLSHALGFELNPISACDIARNKRRTRQVMREAGLPTPAFCSIKEKGDLEEALKTVGFPAVLKPAFGAASLGVFKVNSEEETRRMYTEILKTMQPELDPIWAQGTEVILEEFYDGDEFDIDLLLFDGRCVYAKLADNWACCEPWFQETGLNMPSLYPKGKADELVRLAVDSTLALGFRYGAFHVELKYTSRGPRLIEVNARMGGVAVRDSNLLAWGVDLVEEHCMAMLKIPILPATPEKFLKLHMSYGLIAPYSGTINADDWLESVKEDRRVYKVTYEKKKGDKVTGPNDNLPDWLAEVRCLFDSPEEMISWVEELQNSLEVPIDPSQEVKPDCKFFLPTHAFPFQSV
eukprot:CAMPEP_0198729044 /NCGR_PEP_ID=MMETSP1475-20131203/13952_1 /TAXON_ID= ORGANISM="Unidentified sp., Strain CCMP1999" /NCGR_SAMPLE_ID=MMETSP1475 /ASSEMBLY_ACC=CAM_ASM_001111 /LENGTH=545 /DNA_ID=CAMNT_0044491581 /DNA_START=10 /DNA_END=1643 /DNA_ORIENTATION=-